MHKRNFSLTSGTCLNDDAYSIIAFDVRVDGDDISVLLPDEKDLDAVVLACAGLDRLGLGGLITERLDPDVVLPAPGQGALAVEVRADTRPLLDDALLEGPADALDGLDLEITLGRSVSSAVAVLRGAKPGPTVLLRGDMDGLPVVEQTGLEYASTNGAMHACGHDVHTAALVGAARLLSARRDELAGNITFMFQPGEEGPGGAEPMIREGVLDVTGERPVAAFGLHVNPGPCGTFSYRPGTAMAGANNLSVTFHGRGGHGSQPHTALDPVTAVCEFGTALQTMVTRRFGVFDPVVATMTRLSAGEVNNVIPESAWISGTCAPCPRRRLHASRGS